MGHEHADASDAPCKVLTELHLSHKVDEEHGTVHLEATLICKVDAGEHEEPAMVRRFAVARSIKLEQFHALDDWREAWGHVAARDLSNDAQIVAAWAQSYFQEHPLCNESTSDPQ